MSITPLAALAVIALAPLPAQVGTVDLGPDLIEVAGQGHTRTIPCEGRRVEVMGSGHDLTFTGVCAGLELSGVDNKVTITLAPDAVLDVSGSGQVVRWRSSGQPRQNVSGVDNRVERIRN